MTCAMKGSELKGIDHAVGLISEEGYNKIIVSENIKVYKVPSSNPKKYTIRVDIKVEEE